MAFRRLRGAAIRVAASVVGGGVFYTIWLVAFLSIYSINKDVLNTPLWLLAPIVTSAGFTSGIILAGKFTGVEGLNFWHVYLWPLIGCAAGAVIFHGFGAMPFVIGMLATGTGSVVAREAFLILAEARPQPTF